MKYVGALLVVRDMAKSRAFYEGVLGQVVQDDFGANIAYQSGLSLQTLESWAGFIEKPQSEVCFGANNAELYFEEENLDGFTARVGGQGIELVHGLKEHPWGQRAIRLYDPDGHIVEVGEPIAAAVRRMQKNDMTVEQVMEKMGVQREFVEHLLNQ